eukprot:sb/3474076/
MVHPHSRGSLKKFSLYTAFTQSLQLHPERCVLREGKFFQKTERRGETEPWSEGIGLLAMQRLQTLSLQRRRERYTIILVWKVYNNEIPNNTAMCFADTHRSGPRAVVPRYSYEAQRSNLSLYEQSFAVIGARLWSILPRTVK